MPRDHFIIPIFIPHEGCPYRCVFCDQNLITGAQKKADADEVVQTMQCYLRTLSDEHSSLKKEVAFYGGTFTGLPASRQEALLGFIQPWLDRGVIQSIRVSTHPLFIDPARLDRLKRYRVETVELGIQSTDQETLNKSGRPCSMEVMRRAALEIKNRNFRLGLQLMPGLPGDNETKFQRTVDDAIRMGPNFARLYPTLVIRDTELHRMYLENKYKPWDLERTIESLREAALKFNAAGIPIIRLGSHADRSTLDNLVDGPFHPALRYLVDCRIGLDEMIGKIKARKSMPESVTFKVPERKLSIYTGYKRENIFKLRERFGLKDVLLMAEFNRDRLELVA